MKHQTFVFCDFQVVRICIILNALALDIWLHKSKYVILGSWDLMMDIFF